jgi:hypothetical protein
MNLPAYNRIELEVIASVRDSLKWHLGVEMGIDPETTPRGFVEVEMRLASWLTTGGGGAWLASKPEVSKFNPASK